ncbi:hypothetical protein, partial [Klebsiella pneumoniae]
YLFCRTFNKGVAWKAERGQSPPGLLSSLNSKREASYEKGLFSMSGQTAFSSAGTEGKCSIPVRFLLYSQTEFSIVLNPNLFLL